MTLTTVLFFVFAVLAAASALLMVTRRSPVASAIWLVATFFALAAIYTLLGAFFIGIIQILVYAGAIMILFLFVIMLLNLGNDFEPDIRNNVWKVVAGGTSLVIVALLARVYADGPLPAPLGAAGPRVAAELVARRGIVGVIALPMYDEYMVLLQATAVLLLIAVVGAVVLAKRNV